MNKITNWLIVLPFALLVGCSNQTSKDSSQNGSINEQYGYHESSLYPISGQIDGLESTDTVYFDFNQYDINTKYANLLNQHANFLNSSPNTVVTIEGHADERGTSEYNIALGERRANAVRDYLQSRGVSAQQMNIVSYGKEKPAVLGHTEAVYEKNRRAVLVY